MPGAQLTGNWHVAAVEQEQPREGGRQAAPPVRAPTGTAHTLICICAPKDNCSTSRVNDKATPKTLGLVFP